MYRCNVKLNRCDWGWGITWQGSGRGSWVSRRWERESWVVRHPLGEKTPIVRGQVGNFVEMDKSALGPPLANHAFNHKVGTEPASAAVSRVPNGGAFRRAQVGSFIFCPSDNAWGWGNPGSGVCRRCGRGPKWFRFFCGCLFPGDWCG